MQNTFGSVIGGEGESAKRASVKLVRSRRETKVTFVIKGGPEETEPYLQKIYKSIIS
jgi:hypothetical protein